MAVNYSLNIAETVAKFPPGQPAFKKHLSDTFRLAKLDENSFFGDDTPILTNGTAYKVKMSPANLTAIITLITGRTAPMVKTRGEIKYEIKRLDGKPGLVFEYYVDDNITGKPKIQINLISSNKKKAAGGTGVAKNPDTDEQEKVTLWLFRELLGSKSAHWDKKGYRALRDTVLVKAYSFIGSSEPGPAKWNKHFELQFNEIRDVTKLPNNHFTTYDYDEFMDFIKDIVKGAPPGSNTGFYPDWGSKISQKDSWNPADIWLVKKGGAYKKLKEDIKKATTIERINDVLKVAFHNNIVVGISLKQSSGRPGGLKYDLVNLETTFTDLPDIKFDKMALDLPFNKSKRTFEKKTNEAFVKEKSGAQVGKMRVGSNQTGDQSNITFEFKGTGNVTAMLGKIPKDLMLTRLQKLLPEVKELPNWKDVRKYLPKTADWKKDKNALHWKERTDLIVKHNELFTFGADFKPEHFLGNLVQATTGGKMDAFINADCQIMELAYIFALIVEKKNKKKLDEFIMDMYYYAQKKGKIFGSFFGPFAKLH